MCQEPLFSSGDVLETASANALGHTNKSRTDGAGRTLQTLDATGAITAFTYDANGRRLSVRDPNNVGQDCTYDALGRDLSCTDTAGAVTSQTYDRAGNVKTQTDAKEKVTSLAYDSRGRRLTLTDRINSPPSCPPRPRHDTTGPDCRVAATCPPPYGHVEFVLAPGGLKRDQQLAQPCLEMPSTRRLRHWSVPSPVFHGETPATRSKMTG